LQKSHFIPDQRNVFIILSGDLVNLVPHAFSFLRARPYREVRDAGGLTNINFVRVMQLIDLLDSLSEANLPGIRGGLQSLIGPEVRQSIETECDGLRQLRNSPSCPGLRVRACGNGSGSGPGMRRSGSECRQTHDP
jgi:hypothetical protein